MVDLTIFKDLNTIFFNQTFKRKKWVEEISINEMTYLYIPNTSSFVVKTCFQPNFLSSLHQFFGTYSKLLPCKNIMTTFKPLQFAFKGYIIKLFFTKTWSVGTFWKLRTTYLYYLFFYKKGYLAQFNPTMQLWWPHLRKR